MDKAVNKKEYLKKYLSGGSKKKKKKISSSYTKSKIIDDDIDLKNMRPLEANELEIYDLAEDAPQIAGIVDDRPEEVRIMSEYRETKKWKIVTREYEDVKVSAVGGSDSDPSPSRRPTTSKPSKKSTKKKEKLDSDSDETVTRKQNNDSDATPPRKNQRSRKKSTDSHGRSVKGASVDSDALPPRMAVKHSGTAGTPQSTKRKQKDDSDTSPPRKRKDGRGSDLPERRKEVRRSERADSDEEPPRKQSQSNKGSRKRQDSDEEPPRRHSKVHKESRREVDSDEEPPRKSAKGRRPVDSDEEPPRRSSHGAKVDRGRELDDVRSHKLAKPRRDRDIEHRDGRQEGSRMSQTLDGKKAGLQDASSMRQEAAEIRKRQADSLAALGDEVSGRGATAVMRDRKTGKKRDMKEEARVRKEKEAKEAEIAEKYAVWGKGVRQVDERAVKMKDDLHEMAKPVARYVDDNDLEEMRRNEEKEGDPMLEYIRNKNKKEGVLSKGKTQYQGSYPPNRYGIRPGHRWDGVDRSCGYEKKWFEEKNAKKARDDEAFKWSTEDM